MTCQFLTGVFLFFFFSSLSIIIKPGNSERERERAQYYIRYFQFVVCLDNLYNQVRFGSAFVKLKSEEERNGGGEI